MRSDIDLTPNRDFANHHKDNGIYEKIYKHKEIPWKEKRKESSFCASIGDYMDWSTTSMTTIHNFDIRFDSDYIIDQSFLSDTILQYNTTVNSTSTSTKKLTIAYTDNNSDQKPTTYGNFPTGTREEIIKHRIPDTVKKIPKSYFVCVDCGKKLSKKPWSEVTYLCYECYKETLGQPKAKTLEKSQLWAGNSKIGLNRRVMIGRRNALSITSELDDSYSSKKYYDHKSCPWAPSDTFEYHYNKPNVNGFYGRYYGADKGISERVFRLSLYYKNKNIGNRGTKFQPNGRIPQKYDKLFDDMDWKEMLLERLDDETRKQKQRNIHQKHIESELSTVQSIRNNNITMRELRWNINEYGMFLM